MFLVTYIFQRIRFRKSIGSVNEKYYSYRYTKVLSSIRLYNFHFIITLLGYVEIFWLLFLYEITLWVTNACLRTFHYLGTMLYLFIATICVTLTKVQIKFSSNDVVRTAICTCTHYVEHRYPILLFIKIFIEILLRKVLYHFYETPDKG